MKLLLFCNVWRVKSCPGRDLSIAAPRTAISKKMASDMRVEWPCREMYAVFVQHCNEQPYTLHSGLTWDSAEGSVAL